jgi:hypothetical protein
MVYYPFALLVLLALFFHGCAAKQQEGVKARSFKGSVEGAYARARAVDRYDYCQAPMPSTDVFADFAKQHSNLELVQVNLVTRHGDRAPTQAWPDIRNYTWHCGVDADQELVTKSNGTGSYFQAVFNDDSNPWVSLVPSGTCEMGELTQKGSTQHIELGAALRDMYVDTAGFLPEQFDANTVYARSTDIWRTRISLQSMLLGLYPENTRAKDTVVNFDVADLSIETILPNTKACKQLGNLESEIRSSQVWTDEYKKLTSLDYALANILGSNTQGSYWMLGTYADFFHTIVCHNQPLPCNPNTGVCVTEDQAQATWDSKQWAYDEMYFRYDRNRVSQLGIGMFLGRLRNNMVNAASMTTKFNYYSGHDDTIMALLGALYMDDDTNWSPYRSNLLLELWAPKNGVKSTDDEAASEQVVRLIYNGEVMEMPCYQSTLGGCTLEDFNSIIDKVVLAPEDIQSECAP